MDAVRMVLRTRTRRRRRAWLGLALIAGIAAGATTAAAAGARRSASAYPRLLVWSRGTDISSGGPKDGFVEEEYPSYIAAVERLPQVVASVRTYTPSFTVVTGSGRRTGSFELFTGVEPTGRVGVTIDRIKIVSGRRADPAHDDEATISFAAVGPGLRLGDRIQVALSTRDGSREQLAPVRIVGVHAGSGDFPSVSSPSYLGVLLTPAFFNRYRPFIGDNSDQMAIAVRLRRGARDVPAFVAEASRRRIPLEFPTTAAEFAAGVEKSIRFESIALWLFAALVGVAGTALLAQAMARETATQEQERSLLGALGMSAREVAVCGFGGAIAIGGAAATIAVAIAIAASPLTPIGLARTAEPSPGMRIDGLALGVGAAATMVSVVLASAPSVLVSAYRARRDRTPHRAPSRVVQALARSGAPAPAVTGVRMALERSDGGGEVSGRLWMSGAAGGVAAFVAALIFATSLHHLLATPRLNGYVWDVWLGGGPDLPAALATHERVAAFSQAAGFDVSVSDRRVFAVALDPAGSIRPLIAAGRAPVRDDEIALGGATMRSLRTRIGSSVRLQVAPDSSASAPMRVVGRAVIPPLIFRAHDPGDGVFTTIGGLERVLGDAVRGQGVYVARMRPGTNLRSVDLPAFVLPRRTTGDLSTLSGVSGVPLALAGVLAALGFATLVQLLVTVVRRRRKDLAVLRSLGFLRRNVRATVAWQTSAMMIVALAVGIPAGAIAGRWAWLAFADQIAVFPEPRVPLAALLIVIPATLIMANIAAGFPARSAARTRPAQILRTE
jgi:putative ABC transport system permease protein